MARKVATTIYITEEQQILLRELNVRSKVPIAEYIRQGIDLVLDQNRELLPGQLELDPLPYGGSPTTKNYGSKKHT
ncbi:MAG: ribbon-helix-helix domain-containing protein [Bdellovibrionales bacterium]|nr:ribbon-helix-helix domain-containing protein [Bdellovibrionales bacterium]